MVRYFGGVEGLTAAWTQAIDEALVRHNGSKLVLDSMIAIAKMLKNCEPDIESMDAAETNEFITRRIKTMVRDHPELAVAAAEPRSADTRAALEETDLAESTGRLRAQVTPS